MARTVVGHFPTRAAADVAFDDLTRNGFSRNEISVMGRGVEGKKGLAAEHDHVGAAEGAAVGLVEGLLLGGAAMLIPGIGPVVAVGPIAAGLAGAVTGAATGVVVGGITGALTDAGVDEDTARYYDESFRTGGGVLLAVRADDMEYEKARMIMERHGADVRSGATGRTTHRWDDVRPRYETRWRERHGTTGRFEDYEPGYRYAYEMRSDPRYHGRSWTDVEPEFRRDWEGRYHDRPWDRFGQWIREGWEDDWR